MATFTTEPWEHNEVTPEQAKGLAILLPARAYTVHRPAIHWPATVLAQRGWFLQTVSWSADDLADTATSVEFVERAAQAALDEAPTLAGDQRLVMGKSLGTYAAGWSRTHGLPSIWLTPLLHEQVVVDAVAPGGPTTILIGGSADKNTWRSDEARHSGSQVVELDGANHSLEVADDWRASLALLGEACAAVESFEDAL